MTDFKLSYLNYVSDASELYKKIANLPGFVLLESTDRSRGRYDIVSAYPYDTLSINHSDEKVTNIFNYLQSKITPSKYLLDLPFQGGAIGYFSYDLACLIAGIDANKQKSTMVLPLMEVGLYDWAIITDHYLKTITIFSANTKADTPDIVNEVTKKWHEPCFHRSTFNLKTTFSPYILKSEYEASFHSIHAELKRGRCYQVNYTQPFSADYTGDSWSIYQAVKRENPVPYGAYLRNKNGDILSFSPERFVQMEGRTLMTSPIKGTQRRVVDRIEDDRLRAELEACQKNRAENIMIVDLLRNDLGKIAKPGSVIVSGLCEIESYEAVHHLVSHIHAECRDFLLPLEAFEACFPGGSITGVPKLEAMKVIAEHETVPRGIYCGNIGYFSSHGRFDTNIAIRTMIATQNKLYLQAGGGLVIDSTCEEEYQECFTKIAGILKGLT